MKVLLIDDSRTIRLIIGRMLKELGHEFREAGNGKEALEILKAENGWGLAMVDWNMPEMTGLEFVIAVRSDPQFKSLPLMMVTTETEMANIQKALDAGANEFIMKPFTKETIKDKLTILGF